MGREAVMEVVVGFGARREGALVGSWGSWLARVRRSGFGFLTGVRGMGSGSLLGFLECCWWKSIASWALVVDVFRYM